MPSDEVAAHPGKWERACIYFRREGFLRTIRRIASELGLYKLKFWHRGELHRILSSHFGQPIVVFRSPPLDWNVPHKQRPQHLALQFARQGMCVFFCTENKRYDRVSGFLEIEPNCYLTNRLDLLTGLEQKIIFYVASTENRTSPENIQQMLASGNHVFYDFVDAIDESISRMPIPARTFHRHEMILGDERCLVVATADALMSEVQRHRSKNCGLVTNGAEIEHFQKKYPVEETPEEMKALLDRGQPVIGYYGALASWFDYDLVDCLARERPEYQIALIGVDYDGTLESFSRRCPKNVHLMGAVVYKELPRYAQHFTVSTIPFKINAVTRSTSPIKLFEYMALGHPIVTTDMPECRKYKSALIAHDSRQYIDLMDRAIHRMPVDYYEWLRTEAISNTWELRARDILDLMKGSWE
jgi:teichuronic acid biosynthesis glycosyltransferase TuaH